MLENDASDEDLKNARLINVDRTLIVDAEAFEPRFDNFPPIIYYIIWQNY
jgi:hypothetical protein